MRFHRHPTLEAFIYLASSIELLNFTNMAVETAR
jgi:hypothetical protein